MIKLDVLNKHRPIRRRSNKRAMAGQAKKRSPACGGMSIYFKEIGNAAIER